MKTVAYDSRDIAYKTPFGAVKDGTEVCFHVKLHRDAKASAVYLLCLRDGEADYWWHTLSFSHMEEDFCVYVLSLTFDEGLYFYHFVFDSDFGRKWLTRAPDATARIEKHGPDWQLTVYSADFQVPEGMAGGIYYQIFPDRFFFSGEEKQEVPSDRFLNRTWGAQPAYLQTDEPNRLCNDYFMGDLKGILQKLDYLADLGVSILYLNPIFEAHSNHRYNTADYMKIDPLLGTEADFRALCTAAKQRGIQIMLDGVFSHTGDDSVYYNKYRRYSNDGAYNSTDSPYSGWFKFNRWPDDVHCWWGVPSLPEVVENDPNFSEFITGENGVIDHWIRAGASGLRLDVADELPDTFLEKIRIAVKRANPDALLIGEVWEDATTKISYGSRRKFLMGRQLDSVMNYPFRSAIIGFAKGGDAQNFIDTCMDICENYPPQALHMLMNHIGTHDTSRILTELGSDVYAPNREWQAHQRLTDAQLFEALRLLKISALLQYTLPGMPSLYYGDEAQMEGYTDPFCRGCYPWGKENKELLAFYRKLGQARCDCSAFKTGRWIPVLGDGGALVYLREGTESWALVAVNRNPFAYRFTIPKVSALKPVFGRNLSDDGTLTLPPYTFELFVTPCNPIEKRI